MKYFPGWIGMLLVVVFASLLVWSSGPRHLPAIPGYHWKRDMAGADLFDGEGKRVASLVSSRGFGSDVAQVCYFPDASSCQYRETDSEALAWLVVHMAAIRALQEHYGIPIERGVLPDCSSRNISRDGVELCTCPPGTTADKGVCVESAPTCPCGELSGPGEARCATCPTF